MAQVGISENGMTPAEVYRLAEEDQVPMHRNYPYTALAALVEKGLVRKQDGRYYAISE